MDAITYPRHQPVVIAGTCVWQAEDMGRRLSLPGVGDGAGAPGQRGEVLSPCDGPHGDGGPMFPLSLFASLKSRAQIAALPQSRPSEPTRTCHTPVQPGKAPAPRLRPSSGGKVSLVGSMVLLCGPARGQWGWVRPQPQAGGQSCSSKGRGAGGGP